ncbi:MAG: FHA domain-containing protein [Acidimicrobiales bacterium]|nr:FHA domain-containing protein [Acidimicrobiales bacterium]
MSGNQCPSCGHENPTGSNFCSSCGRQLIDAADTPTDAIDVVSLHADTSDTGETPAVDDDFEADRAKVLRGVGLFVVRRGPKAGSRYALDADTITAGRHPDSDIFLDDVTVSRRHAEVRNQNGDYAVRDVGSLNGTYLNKNLVDDTFVPLSDGDELQVGKFKLVFLYGAA